MSKKAPGISDDITNMKPFSSPNPEEVINHLREEGGWTTLHFGKKNMNKLSEKAQEISDGITNMGPFSSPNPESVYIYLREEWRTRDCPEEEESAVDILGIDKSRGFGLTETLDLIKSSNKEVINEKDGAGTSLLMKAISVPKYNADLSGQVGHVLLCTSGA